MFRSMILVCALGALGAAGCVGASDAADEAATTQNSGGGLFDCQNKASISGVQCVGAISILNGLTVNIKDVRVLDGNELNVLSGDLNNVKVLDGNILDGNKILNDVEVTTLNDFLNKFNINVTKNDIDVCALVGICI
jgi:hypothetical protein